MTENIHECMDKLSEELLNWYQKERRVLPWREDPSPYHVWLSEIMLQQTRVETVVDYYLRFIERLPSVRSLAEASEETYTKLWEGLGYYSRVRNLHRAALMIEEEYGGVIPGTSKELSRLPGIGPYTSAAIASIAFGEAVPAVDGNLLRIFSRLALYSENIRTPDAFHRAVEYYSHQMPDSNPELKAGNPCGDFNQALMDLGARICLPNREPLCGECPLAAGCRAHIEMPGKESQLPVMPARKEKKTEQLTVFVIRSEDRTAVRKRPGKGLLAGLYEFPNARGALDTEEAVKWLRDHGVEPIRIRRTEDAEHVFTHKIWKMRGYEVQADVFSGEKIPFIMVGKQELKEKYSIPSAFSAYFGRICEE